VRPSSLFALPPTRTKPPDIFANKESFFSVSSLFGTSSLNSKRTFSTAASVNNSCRSAVPSCERGSVKIEILVGLAL